MQWWQSCEMMTTMQAQKLIWCLSLFPFRAQLPQFFFLSVPSLNVCICWSAVCIKKYPIRDWDIDCFTEGVIILDSIHHCKKWVFISFLDFPCSLAPLHSLSLRMFFSSLSNFDSLLQSWPMVDNIYLSNCILVWKPLIY